MAFEMSFTDEFGEVYPNSYWKVVQCNIARFEKSGLVVFQGFKDAANVGKRIIGHKEYIVDEALYDAYFSTDMLDPQGENPYRAAYLMALAIKDVSSAVEGDPSVSFFENAQPA